MQIQVEVIFALPEQQIIRQVVLNSPVTVADAIEASGLLQDFPEIDLKAHGAGVFGEPRELDDVLQMGDRVEIYRPLIADPKETRRHRAQGTATNQED